MSNRQERRARKETAAAYRFKESFHNDPRGCLNDAKAKRVVRHGGVLPAPVCDHDWRFVSDWYGDPGVINGTADCSFYECRKCGDEQTTQPEDYCGPDPDGRDDYEWEDDR